MRALAALAAATALAALAAAAKGDPGHDPYITGRVVERVAGRNAAEVAVRWGFGCLGDIYAPATFDWTLNLVRRLPRPERRTRLLAGSTKSGQTRLRLPPGKYDLVADPFECELDRFGWRAPEWGRPFVVPDYCSFERERPRGIVRPGTSVTATAATRLASREHESALTLQPGSRLRVERGACRTGGWRVRLLRGTVRVTARPDDRRRYEVVTSDALVRAGRGRWTVRHRGGKTRVRVSAGRVVVRRRG